MNTLEITLPCPDKDIQLVRMNGKEYQITGKDVTKITLECAPGDVPKLNIEYGMLREPDGELSFMEGGQC